MTAFDKIQVLIETRINGNSIKGNKTYENMIKSLRTKDFSDYDLNFFGTHLTMYIYKKINKIECYVDTITEQK